MSHDEARYQWFPPEVVAAMSPDARADYLRMRARFDAEVEQHKGHIARTGWINLAKPGKPENRYYIRGRK